MPPVTVHRCILAARSGFFRAMLEGAMGEARHGELTLKVSKLGPAGITNFWDPRCVIRCTWTLS